MAKNVTVDQLAATACDDFNKLQKLIDAKPTSPTRIRWEANGALSRLQQALAVLAVRATQAEAEAELKRIETHHANAKRRDAEDEAARLRGQLDASRLDATMAHKAAQIHSDHKVAAESRCAQLEQALEDEVEMMEQSRERLAYLKRNWQRIADGDGDDSEHTIERDLDSLIEDLDPSQAREALAGPDTP